MSTPRRLALISILSAGLLGLSGCDLLDPDPGEPRLELDGAPYAPGDTVRLQLINDSSRDVLTSQCFSSLGLQRETEDGWERVFPSIVCLPIRALAAPGDTVERMEPVEEELAAPGSYRFRVHAAAEGMQRTRLDDLEWVLVARFEVVDR